jgi:hyperosmotically inducible protein
MSQFRTRISFCAIPFLISFSVFADTTTPNTAHEVDNTAVNVRDRDGKTLTAGDQANGSRSDVEITRDIRQQIVKDDTFSTSAKNVKIITKNGMVVLRGPVASSEERTKIASIAQNSVGVSNVKNKLEVKNQ